MGSLKHFFVSLIDAFSIGNTKDVKHVWQLRLAALCLSIVKNFSKVLKNAKETWKNLDWKVSLAEGT